MSIPYYSHFCPVLGKELPGKESCKYCGRKGHFIGMGPDMHEAMWRYQWRTGLKPLGPHRSYADKALKDAFILCKVCHG
ncbi:MAG: hypothetical protein H6Q38_3197, partial [Chloroflexi bacterium]|nr:hypothetical protein [Chloroflexota bacterium]